MSSRTAFGVVQFTQHLSVQAVPVDRLMSWIFLKDKRWRVRCFTCLISPVAYFEHKAEKTYGSADHTDCLSQPVLFLFETNKYIPGLPTHLEEVCCQHPWCLRKLPKEALSMQLGVPERVSDT